MELKVGKVKTPSVPKGQHSILEIFPFKSQNITEDGLSYLVTTDNKYISWQRINPQNIRGLNRQDQNYIMSRLEFFEKVFNEEHSIVSLMFPANLEPQIKYATKCLNQARKNNELHKIQKIQATIRKFQWIQANQPNSEFYLVLYADSLSELRENIQSARRAGGVNMLGFNNLSMQDLEKIVYKLNNMNSTI